MRRHVKMQQPGLKQHSSPPTSTTFIHLGGRAAALPHTTRGWRVCGLQPAARHLLLLLHLRLYLWLLLLLDAAAVLVARAIFV
jgi:hypothetical protein